MKTWKPTLCIQLTWQEPEPSQPELFAFGLPARTMPERLPECAHLTDALQARFDGEMDRVCASCAAVLESIEDLQEER